jgi:hypothetical protein
VTHHRETKRKRKIRAHELAVESKYQITGEEYNAIFEAQDGMCFVCRRAKGISRHLCVDHDHHFHDDEDEQPHDPSTACRECIRCLACDTCNRIVLGRYDVDALVRAIVVLTDPPARKVLAQLCYSPTISSM